MTLIDEQAIAAVRRAFKRGRISADTLADVTKHGRAITMRTARDWKRLGSEAQSDDVRAGYTGEMTDADLRDALALHFDGDLNNPELCEDYGAALDALVDGYHHGG